MLWFCPKRNYRLKLFKMVMAMWNLTDYIVLGFFIYFQNYSLLKDTRKNVLTIGISNWLCKIRSVLFKILTIDALHTPGTKRSLSFSKK